MAIVLFITGLGIGTEALQNIFRGNYADIKIPGILAMIAATTSIIGKEVKA